MAQVEHLPPPFSPLHRNLNGWWSRKAKDFVRCTDPMCPVNKDVARHQRQFPTAPARGPHCHPVF